MKRREGAAGTDPTSSFLSGLANVPHHSLVERAKGVILLELTDHGADDHWIVTLDHGRVEVANHPGPADAVVRMTQRLFGSVVVGSSNLWEAILRGDVVVDGDLHLVAAFQRLLPGPSSVGMSRRRSGPQP